MAQTLYQKLNQAGVVNEANDMAILYLLPPDLETLLLRCEYKAHAIRVEDPNVDFQTVRQNQIERGLSSYTEIRRLAEMGTAPTIGFINYDTDDAVLYTLNKWAAPRNSRKRI